MSDKMINMSEQERRQKQFFNRAQHQLRQIQFSCREVVGLAQSLKLVATQVNDSEVTHKKIEFIKCEIKEKLREVASNVDQIYKILDRKIVILTSELGKHLNNPTSESGSKQSSQNTSLIKMRIIEKDTQRTNQPSHPSLEQDKIFSDTLNPRVAQLQAKVAQFQKKQVNFNMKINQLKAKNQKLLQEFDRLSTASNKKINQLSWELNRTSKERDSFNSLENSNHSKKKDKDRNQPFLNFDLQLQPPPKSPKKYQDKNTHQTGEYNFNMNKTQLESKSRPFTFGCMPGRNLKEQNSSDALSMPKMSGESFENLDKEDRHRRFDLLLNKLRYTEGEQSKTPPSTALAKKPEQQTFTSVFSKEVIKRYQV